MAEPMTNTRDDLLPILHQPTMEEARETLTWLQDQKDIPLQLARLERILEYTLGRDETRRKTHTVTLDLSGVWKADTKKPFWKKFR